MFVFTFSDIIGVVLLILIVVLFILGYIIILIKDKLTNIKRNKTKKEGE